MKQRITLHNGKEYANQASRCEVWINDYVFITSELLRAAKARINTPERWIKGADALRLEPWLGCFTRWVVCGSRHPDAGAWCATGALGSVVPKGQSWARAAAFLFRAVPGRHPSIPAFNDDPKTTHEDVMALFDRAIAAAEREET